MQNVSIAEKEKHLRAQKLTLTEKVVLQSRVELLSGMSRRWRILKRADPLALDAQNATRHASVELVVVPTEQVGRGELFY